MAGAQALYGTMITMSLSFMVFTFGSLLVAIQVASGQLTPRIIATTLLRITRSATPWDFSCLRCSTRCGHLIGWTRTWRSSVLSHAGLLGLTSMVMFLYLIDYAARLLRPSSIVWRVGEAGLAVLRTVHPRELEEVYREPPPPPPLGGPDAVITHRGKSGTLLALNQEALTSLAQQSGGIIEFVPHIGDFIAIDEPLFRLYGSARMIPLS